jgi:trk system potassium uptake protein TrkH
MQLSPVINILGLLTTVLAAAMLIPMCVDLYSGSGEWQIFALSALLTAFFGVSAWLATNRREALDLGLRQAFLLTNGAWFLIGIFGALPFLFSELNLSLTDSVFESVSGITTTGSTILPFIEIASPGILMWRALLQWLGGVGIVVMAMAVLPMLSVGGMQLFRTESYERAENVVPRATQLAGGIGLIYTGLTAIWAIMLGLAGMNMFDAVTHAMTTLATGGYSTRTASIGAFDSVTIEWIVILGMIVGSLPFAHYLAVTRGGWRNLINDPQVRWFLLLVAGLIILLSWYLTQSGQGFSNAFRQASFNAVSIMTGTGYVSANYSAWGGFASTILLMAMFIGGCGGSTTCGIKVFRLQVLAATARVQINRLLRPHAVVLAGDGIFLPLYSRICVDRHPTWHDGAGFCNRSFRGGHIHQQCWPRARRSHRRGRQFFILARFSKMGDVIWHATWPPGNFHRSCDVKSGVLATVNLPAPR